MGTKMKGLFKGLRYISHIFEEEKEEEIQIGFPTDVKHVAHIGWDGQSSVDSSPSWMKEFKTPTAFQSAPLLPPVDSRRNAEIQWVSEDSKRSNRSAPNSPCSDHFPEKAKSSRHQSLTDNNLNDSPKRKEKPRSSRRSKDTSGGSIIVSSRLQQDCNSASSSPARALLPGVPKKTHRKKSKDLNGDGSSQSRSKGGPSSEILTSPFHERDGGSPLSSIVNGEEVEC